MVRSEAGQEGRDSAEPPGRHDEVGIGADPFREDGSGCSPSGSDIRRWVWRNQGLSGKTGQDGGAVCRGDSAEPVFLVGGGQDKTPEKSRGAEGIDGFGGWTGETPDSGEMGPRRELEPNPVKVGQPSDGDGEGDSGTGNEPEPLAPSEGGALVDRGEGTVGSDELLRVELSSGRFA